MAEFNFREIMTFAIFRPSIYLVSVIAMILVIRTGSLSVLNGSLSLGTLFVFITYISSFYFPVMHHNNFICMLDRRKPVCDHDRSSSIHQTCKCLCDQCFGFCIDVGSCFIENKDLRIISKCPCEGQKLALPGR